MPDIFRLSALKLYNPTPLAAVLVTACAIAGCTPIGMAVGAGATVGVAAFQERPMGEAWDDTEIELGLADRMFKRKGSLFSDVSSEVMEGRVMLTGIVKRESQRAEATQIAWSVPGVRRVINEIEVGDRSTFEALPGDAWISTKLTARMMTDFSIADVNYATEVVNGSVYVLGIGQDEAEIDRVAAHARDISGVRRVVMHAITVDDTRRMAARPADAPAAQPFKREPSGDRQGHVLAENNANPDLLTGQPPLREDLSEYDNAPAIETASTQPAYEPAYENAPALAGPRQIAPQSSGTIESRDLAPIR